MTIHKKGQQGFTLIELSIVLVIIGLIVGGVLVGQDLIKAAQLRSQITQLEQYDATVNTFRSKYNGLPGDLLNATNSFGAGSVPDVANCNVAAALAISPANGAFESCAGTRTALTGEMIAFWKQLYDSNLIVDPITRGDLIGGLVNAAVPGSGALSTATTAELPNIFPTAKLGNGNFIVVYTGNNVQVPQPGMAGVNIYRITGFGAAPITAAGAPTFANAMTPLEAYQVDTKKDDGIYNTGVVQAVDNVAAANFNGLGAGPNDIATPGAALCINNAATSAYNTNTANGNNRLCQLLIRASF